MTRICLALVVSLIAGVRTVAAQDRLFVGAREVGAAGHFGADLGPASDVLQYPRFGGERYVHVPGTGVIDLRTGVAKQVGEGFAVAYDRARPRIFVGRSDGVWAVDVSTSWSFLILPADVAGLASCVHATSADVLLCAFARPDGQHDIVRSGPSGPVLVSTTRFADAFLMNWVVTPDASRVYLLHCARTFGGAPPYFCMQRDIAMVDVATGVVRTAGGSLVAVFSTTELVWDEVHDRLFAVSYGLGAGVDVFTRDLVQVGSAVTSGDCRDLAISPHTGRIYLNIVRYHYGVEKATLSAYDAATLDPLELGETRTTTAACPVTLVTAPGRPRGVQATVSGHDVFLTWVNIGAASSFVLDVGFAPGRTDLSLFVGPEPFARFSGVPPGTYYMRLRGGNEVGGGRPSAEVVVRVP